MFTEKEANDYVKSNAPDYISKYKFVYMVDDEQVIIVPKDGTKGCKWLWALIKNKFVVGEVYNDITLGIFFVVERLIIKTEYKSSPYALLFEKQREAYMKERSPAVYNFARRFCRVQGIEVKFDLKLRNIGWRDDGTPVFFDIVNY